MDTETEASVEGSRIRLLATVLAQTIALCNAMFVGYYATIGVTTMAIGTLGVALVVSACAMLLAYDAGVRWPRGDVSGDSDGR